MSTIKIVLIVFNPCNDGRSFSLSNTVILFSRQEFAPTVGVDHLSTVLNLSQDITEAFITGVCS